MPSGGDQLTDEKSVGLGEKRRDGLRSVPNVDQPNSKNSYANCSWSAESLPRDNVCDFSITRSRRRCGDLKSREG